MTLPEAQIQIFIKKKPVKQGKFFYLFGKPSYIANCTENKWFRNFSGYAIAKQIIDNLPKGTRIVYKRVDLNQHYITNKSRFYNKGVPGFWGDHQQIVLPIKQWEWKEGKPAEKFNLPLMSLSKWKKLERGGGKTSPVLIQQDSPHVEDFSIPPEVGSRLADIFFSKYPEMRRANG